MCPGDQMCSADQCSTQLPEGLGILFGKICPDDREGREAGKGAAAEPVLLGSVALCFCSHQVFSYMHQGCPVNWAFPVIAMLCSDEAMGVVFFGFCFMEHKHYGQYGENQNGSSVLKLSLFPALTYGQWDPGWV